MAQENELQSAQFLNLDDYRPAAAPPPEAPRPNGGGLLRSIGTFCTVAVAGMLISSAAIALYNSQADPHASADMFLWLAGQKKTWKEYQREQKAAGRGRLDEKEYDWTQQLLNDAYSRER
jgi:hypothetical protein